MMYQCAAAAASGRRVAVKKAGRKRQRIAIDIHCHVLTPEAETLTLPHFTLDKAPAAFFATAQTREINRRQAIDRHEHLTSVTRRLADMDRLGIDIQAISPAPPQYYYWTEPELGRQTARLINDRLAEVVAGHPDRFVALGTVPLQQTELAVAELERCVRELGFRGIEIGGNVAGEELATERLRPFFAKAQELGILLFLHPLGYTEGKRLSEHYFNNVIGNPLDSTVAVGHLIFGGVLERYPRLKICVAHGGGYLPAYAGRMDHAHAARGDCRVHIRKKPSSYLRKLYFDTVVFDPAQLENLVRLYGADHILLGSDYPYDMAEDDPVGFVQSVKKLKAAERQAILRGNAAKLLKIK